MDTRLESLSEEELLTRYNYDEFTPEKYQPWMRFHESPPLGKPGPDFPLWRLEDKAEVKLSDIWSSNTYTIIEFGSFT